MFIIYYISFASFFLSSICLKMSNEDYGDEVNTDSRVLVDNSSDIPVEPDRTTGEVSEEDSGAVVSECTSLFSTSDFIMEPNVVQVLLRYSIFNHDAFSRFSLMFIFYSFLSRYFQFGGMPDEAVRLLSENYCSVAQAANLLCDCLVMSGVNVNQIQERVESSLRQLLVKRFEPQRADSLFANEADVYFPPFFPHSTCICTLYKL